MIGNEEPFKTLLGLHMKGRIEVDGGKHGSYENGQRTRETLQESKID